MAQTTLVLLRLIGNDALQTSGVESDHQWKQLWSQNLYLPHPLPLCSTLFVLILLSLPLCQSHPLLKRSRRKEPQESWEPIEVVLNTQIFQKKVVEVFAEVKRLRAEVQSLRGAEGERKE